MKLVIAIVDQALEPDVRDVFVHLDIHHYTYWTDVRGSGETGIKRGTPVYPGLNTIFMIACADEAVKPFIERMHEVRDSFPLRPGMKILVVPAEMY
jgi:nitrogen regulatory protein PII